MELPKDQQDQPVQSAGTGSNLNLSVTSAPQKGSRKLYLILAIFLIVTLIGGGAFYFLKDSGGGDGSESIPSLKKATGGLQGKISEQELFLKVKPKSFDDAKKEIETSTDPDRKAKGTEFLVNREKDPKYRSDSITEFTFNSDNKGLYLFFPNRDMSFKEIRDSIVSVDNKAEIDVMFAGWNPELGTSGQWMATEQNYYKKVNEKGDQLIRELVADSELETAVVKKGQGVVIMAPANILIPNGHDSTFPAGKGSFDWRGVKKGWILLSAHGETLGDTFKDDCLNRVSTVFVQNNAKTANMADAFMKVDLTDKTAFKSTKLDKGFYAVWVYVNDQQCAGVGKVSGGSTVDKDDADAKAKADADAKAKADADAKAKADADAKAKADADAKAKADADAKAKADADAKAKADADAKAKADADAKAKKSVDHTYTVASAAALNVDFIDGAKSKYSYTVPDKIKLESAIGYGNNPDDTYVKILLDGTDIGYFEFDITAEKKFKYEIKTAFKLMYSVELNGNIINIKYTPLSVPGTTGSGALGVMGSIILPVLKDHIYEISGNTLKVTFMDNSKADYGIKKPDGLALKPVKGYEDNLDDTYVEMRSSDEKYVGYVEFNKDKEFKYKLEDAFKNDYTVALNGSTISITTVTPTPHSEVVKAFNEGLLWQKVNFEDTKWASVQAECDDDDNDCLEKETILEQDPDKGDMSFTFRIKLSDVTKTKLQNANDDQFYFKYAYKQYWGSHADELIKSDPIPFRIVPEAKFTLTDSNNKEVKDGKIYVSDKGEIYIRVVVPWPGLAITSDKNLKDWGRVDVDIYFYDTSKGPTDAQQLTLTQSKYQTLEILKPNLYVNVSAGGCLGIGDWDYQVGNSGGPLPTDAYDRILFYISGDGYGPKTLKDAFGDASPIKSGGGTKSDWECHDSGNGKTYLVRDTILGNTTIWTVQGAVKY